MNELQDECSLEFDSGTLSQGGKDRQNDLDDGGLQKAAIKIIFMIVKILAI